MNIPLTSYIIALSALLACDIPWLLTMGSRFYKPLLSHLMAESASIAPIILFYALYALGVTIFVVLPGLHAHESIVRIALRGAFLGLIAYGAYDFTNQATLKNWPWIVTVVDLAWGSFLTGLASVITTTLVQCLK